MVISTEWSNFSSVVNFIDILGAAFAPISQHQKIKKAKL